MLSFCKLSYGLPFDSSRYLPLSTSPQMPLVPTQPLSSLQMSSPFLLFSLPHAIILVFLLFFFPLPNPVHCYFPPLVKRNCTQNKNFLESKILTMAIVKNSIFCYIVSCNTVKVNHCFRGKCCPSLPIFRIKKIIQAKNQ